MDADGVLGPVGIVVANAILGEVTPAMAEAVGSWHMAAERYRNRISGKQKSANRCNTTVC